MLRLCRAASSFSGATSASGVAFWSSSAAVVPTSSGHTYQHVSGTLLLVTGMHGQNLGASHSIEVKDECSDEVRAPGFYSRGSGDATGTNYAFDGRMPSAQGSASAEWGGACRATTT